MANNWQQTLKELTDAFLEDQRYKTEDIISRRVDPAIAQKEKFAADIQNAEAAMQARQQASITKAQRNYAAMAASVQGSYSGATSSNGITYTGSGSTGVKAATGGKVTGTKGLAVGRNQVTVKAAGKRFTVNRKYQDRFVGFVRELGSMYKITSIGGYNPRNIAGTGTKSLHSYGTAIDINPTSNARGTRGNMPPRIAELAAKYGLVWGGNWKYTDPMHFEVAGLYNPIKLKR